MRTTQPHIGPTPALLWGVLVFLSDAINAFAESTWQTWEHTEHAVGRLFAIAFNLLTLIFAASVALYFSVAVACAFVAGFLVILAASALFIFV